MQQPFTQYKEVISALYTEIHGLQDPGHVATYIPELAQINPDRFGIHITSTGGEQFGIGDDREVFSIQSIAKVLSLCMAYRIKGEELWSRVGVEPSGTAFNSLVQLESDKGIPRNPFKNAGAMVICDILVSNYKHPKREFLEFCRMLSGDDKLDYSQKIADSERAAGYRNVALCNFIKSFGNIQNDPETVLDMYFSMCSIEMDCKLLSETFLFLANSGMTASGSTEVLTKSQAKRINALMQTCGFYDESGEFAFKVGLPGKSGVGGGIIAIHPGHYAIAVWSPRLNNKGNSYKGMQFLEEFTTRTELSIF